MPRINRNNRSKRPRRGPSKHKPVYLRSLLLPFYCGAGANHQVPSLLLDDSAKILEANRAAVEMIGTDAAALKGRSFGEVVLPEDAVLFLEHLRQCRNGSQDPVMTQLRLSVPGRILELELVSYPIQRRGGQLLVRTVFLDCARKQIGLGGRGVAEQIVQMIDAPIALLDSRLRIVATNGSFQRLFKTHPPGMLGEAIVSLPHLRWHTKGFRKILEDTIRGRDQREMHMLECEHVPHQQMMTLLLTIRPLRTGPSHEMLLLLQFQNVTARMDAEAEREHLIRELQLLSSHLEERVRKRTFELREANVRLRDISRRLFDAQENERRHVAAELHDEIGQMLTGMKLLLDSAGGNPSAESLGEAKEVLRALMMAVRDLSLRLRPQLLDDLGLEPALRQLASRVGARSGIQVILDFKCNATLPSDVSTAIYRVVQESLTNTVKHATAKKSRIEVRPGKESIRFCVSDDGSGIREPVVPGTSTGLSAMRERIELLGGALRINSRPGKGIKILCHIPLKH